MTHRPEVLAPAGSREALEAAVRAGADAVYFGLKQLNARARAHNFAPDELEPTMEFLRRHGVHAYVTLNTLVFDSEFELLAEVLESCVTAGVDAVIVQDLGAARVVRELAPSLRLHASTQMTCTDAASVEFARSLGASRIVLARELSLAEIGKIRAQTDAELEVFVHGALCVAYSGQCLTSEAIGGRSANRGACAQACRLPYELYVDGVRRELGERAYLLSPEDLEASALVPELVELRISSLKIEGRLKGPEYVAATTSLYRRAVDAALEGRRLEDEPARHMALQMYSRGSGPGFLNGVDHQRLVEARSCDHRGTLLGECIGTRRVGSRTFVLVKSAAKVARGDGILLEGGFAGEGEIGGRVWAITARGQDVPRAEPMQELMLWLGPDVSIPNLTARRVFKTNDPLAEKTVQQRIASVPFRVPLRVRVSGQLGELPSFEAWSERGAHAKVHGRTPIEQASNQPTTASVIREKLGRLGETPFVLGDLELNLPAGSLLPLSSLNQARRDLVAALLANPQTAKPSSRRTLAEMRAELTPPDRPPPAAGLFVLCRTLEQCKAALTAGANGVYIDFLELTGTGAAVRTLREQFPHAVLGVAPPRIRKPGEEKIDRFLAALAPDVILVRGLGALSETRADISRVGDFSLNVTNRLTAKEVLSKGVVAFTPSFDLDSAQLVDLLSSPFGVFAEVVVHHPMALFHMEHCVFAALLSNGADFRTCGRPCEHHELSLRDRAGVMHPVAADVGCRNTVFHGSAQSAAMLVPALTKAGVRRFRIECVRETADRVERLVSTYKRLIAGEEPAQSVWTALNAENGYGVVRGSLRAVST